MAKTKKKSYELDAVQFDPTQLPLPDGVMSAADAAIALLVPVPPGSNPPENVWYVIVWGGYIPLHPGDWIVTDPNPTIDREFLTPEVFDKKYEKPTPTNSDSP